MKHFSSLIIFALALSLQSLAAVNILFNPSFGNWNIAGNWHLGRVPTVNDNPIISAGRTAMIDSDVNQCAVVFCGQSASIPCANSCICKLDYKTRYRSKHYLTFMCFLYVFFV